MGVLAEKIARRFAHEEELARHRSALAMSSLRDLRQLQTRIGSVRRSDPQKPIVVISLLERMGDIVACEPVIRHIKREMPDAYIIWLAKPAHVDLLATHPLVDHIGTLFCLTEWMMLKRLLKVDRIVDLHVNRQCCLICKITAYKPDDASGITLDNYYRHGGLLSAFAQGAGLPALDDTPVLHLPDSVRRKVDALSLPERFVVFHCTSEEPARNWGDGNWQALAARLIEEEGSAVVEVGLQPALAQAAPDRVVNLCRSLSVLETAEVIRRAALFAGIDSGPAHLASAVGTYGVILLGKYRMFDSYLPYSGSYADGSNSSIVRADGPASSLAVETVHGAIRQGLERTAHTIDTRTGSPT